jgi:signal transduction histidine kinase
MKGISSNRIIDKKESILTLWKDRCLKEVASAGTATSLALRNSLPIYLDHLAEALATNRKMDFKSVFSREEEATRIGKMHGADRAGNKNYELTEVIFEYHILREVIFQVLENDGALAEIQRDIILDSIEQAVNDAAVRFSEIHTDIQQNFVDTLTHDLKNPIAAAKMNAEIMIAHYELSDRAINSTKKIIGNLGRLEAMIKDLLDGSRIHAGESLTLQFTKCDLNVVIHEVIGEMTIVHGDRFILESKDAVASVWGCDGIRRAIENLVENAAKYSFPETPINVSLRREKNGVKIIVQNQGKVIPPDEMPFLFLPRRRSQNSEENQKVGWGLGLTLVKGVAEAHHGTISVESNENAGTRRM